MSTNLLILGIDAASPDLLRRWADEGKLPAIRKLMTSGLSGAVQGVEGFFIGSTWPSFYTGLNPAGHGIHYGMQLRPGSYDFYNPLAAPHGMGGKPFWKIASDAGRHVAVLDVPLARLESDLNGLQLVEWGSHDAVFGFQASSSEFVRDLMAKVGPYPMPSNCDGKRETSSDFDAFVAGLEVSVAKKADLTIGVLGHQRWDMLIQVFTEAHCVGHQCWHIHDPRHPAHDPELLRTIGDPLERVYKAVDRAVARILAHAGNCHVILVSAHGMSCYRGAPFLLPEILFRLGVTVRSSTESVRARGLRTRTMALARNCWSMLPEVARSSIRPLHSMLTNRRTKVNPLSRVDLRESKCFPVANGSPVGGIRLNLAGREPFGTIRQGAEADAFCEELAADLYAVINERTGRPLIAKVHRTDSLYSGPRRDALPDLLIEWDDAEPVGTLAHAAGRGATVRAASAKIGTAEGSNSYGRTGDHVPVGMFVFAGPHVEVGEKREPVSLMDFHPSICRLLGLADPGVDGTAIGEFVIAANSPC